LKRPTLGFALLLLCFSASAQTPEKKVRASYSFVTAEIIPGEAADRVVHKDRNGQPSAPRRLSQAQMDSLLKSGEMQRSADGTVAKISSKRTPVPDEEVKARLAKWDVYKRSWRGKPVPDVTFQDREGTLYRLSELQGKVVVLNFGYRGCGACQKDRGMMEEVAKRFQPNPEVPEVLFLMPILEAADQLPEDETTRLIVLPQSGKVARDVFQVKAWPTTFLIDKKGVIKSVVMGSHSNTVAQLSNAIQKLLLQ